MRRITRREHKPPNTSKPPNTTEPRHRRGLLAGFLLGGAVLAVFTANPASSSEGRSPVEESRRAQARSLSGLLEIRHTADVSAAPTTVLAHLKAVSTKSTTSTTSTTVAPTTTTTVAPTTTTTTTAPTTTTEAPAPAAPPASGDAVHDAIGQYFGDVYDAAVRVASCESGMNPRAVSPGGGNLGLFQINEVHRGRVSSMGYSWDQIFDPYVNSHVARSIYDEAGGWGPWTCQP